jgi:hypothetical protein
MKPRVRLEAFGPSLDGRDVDVLTIGAGRLVLRASLLCRAIVRGMASTTELVPCWKGV